MQTQLQITSSYSLLQSPIKLPELIDSAKQMGYSSLALTDNNNLYGSIDFYKYCQNAGIKPIIGLTINTLGVTDTQNVYPLILLAKSDVGYHNLIKISSRIMSSEDPVEFSVIADFLHDLFIITPAQNSEVLAINEYVSYCQIIGQNSDPHSLYLGVGLFGQQINNVRRIKKISDETEIPMVALSDIRYLKQDDHLAYQVLNNIRTGNKFESLDDVVENGEFYLRSAEEMDAEFSNVDMIETVKTADSIAQRCNVKIEFKSTELPEFKTPAGTTSAQFLMSLTVRGLSKRLNGQVSEKYQKRLKYELGVIEEMGFSDYFLIVWDVIKHAHESGIKTGPGRGSAAGSLVAYTLGITQVDPIKYDLLFERFLNPQRVNMPDIDLDLPDDRRDEMVQYMHDKYGADHMAQIITFGTLAAKMALRDIARTFGQNQFQMSRWSEAIPKQLNISLKESLDQSETLRSITNDSEENKLIFKVAQRIEGIPRHYSTHAAGIVLSKSPMTDIVAVQLEDDGINLTQQTKNNVESLGLLKMDFLGLRNLTILDNSIRLISEQTGQQFHPEQIPLDDRETLELFQKGDTDGVFQFESDGIKSVLRRLKPTHFNDVVATNALYRPGPMQNIDTFIKRKHGDEPVEYPDSSLEKILKPTYGVLVYQEQVMQASSEMAGFSLADADLLRRAISKKNEDLMNANHKKFVDGAVKLGHDRQAAENVYDYIETFGNYGFNKSHSVAYSMIAFWLAYIKVHYPNIFFTCLMNSNLNNETKTANYVQAAKDRGIKILNVDINQSTYNFKVGKDSIRFGFLSIKGMRRDFSQSIVNERSQRGQFISPINFLQRIDPRFVKSDYIEPLVLTGGFDQFNRNRKEMLLDIRDLVESMQLAGNNISLFDTLEPKKHQVDDYSLTEKLNQEKEFLGIYISGHPVEKYRNKLLNLDTVKISHLSDYQGRNVNLLGLIKSMRVIRTKKGEQMAFATAEDETGSISITIFPRLYKKIQSEPLEGKILVIVGKPNTGMRGDLEVIADRINDPQQYMVRLPKDVLYLKVPKYLDKPDKLTELYDLVESSHGDMPVIVYRESDKQSVLLKQNRWIKYDKAIKLKLETFLGEKNVFLKKGN
ncbi:DNA polymerase III subunit alpha [Companilactobacillus sp.]|uniref:DNA polymerase III subunit alpha n=3 Tax=Companilactobacillus sp. TaxID=2767905 RepID=UPI0025BE8E39|nr:DNA polymerase III subunit alpha [Companilactobacillus sp.]MCH4008331.1 DNA polymerase III subunit alpha [Companilactobacillus sp.]MCH4051490.1 DNA polymerase III subunit alpha [Companilactobacillus sp.]MCH4076274.1 DNA polymerase III subunit alpha [Companilactobacillus sp.]MCH4124849.1 DNA polymerase III subunit alpha [Companilactobacillus sp.]MCH4131391.1 DNA polymerase III subunit alpha [Companilactobacillus sp.]